MTTVATDYKDPRDYGRAVRSALSRPLLTSNKGDEIPEDEKSDSEGNEKGTSDATRLRFTRESASKGVRRCAEPEPGMFARWASLLPSISSLNGRLTNARL